MNHQKDQKSQHNLGKQEPSTHTRRAGTSFPPHKLPTSVHHGMMSYWVMQKFAHLVQLHIWIPFTHLLHLQEIVSLPSNSPEAADLLLSSESHCFPVQRVLYRLRARTKRSCSLSCPELCSAHIGSPLCYRSWCGIGSKRHYTYPWTIFHISKSLQKYLQ